MRVLLAPDNGEAHQRSPATPTSATATPATPTPATPTPATTTPATPTPATATPATATPAAGAPARRAHPLRTMVVDILAPIGLYYGIRAAGGSVWLALLVGGVAPAVSAVTGILTRRRVDAMGLVMLAALGASAAFSLISGSPRALLARDGLVTAAWAGYMYLSLLARRPATFTVSRPLLEGRRVFDPAIRGWAGQPVLGRALGAGAAVPADLADLHRHLGHRDPGRRGDPRHHGLRAPGRPGPGPRRRALAGYLHRAAGDNQCLLRPIRVLAHPAYRSIVLTSVDHRKCQAMRGS